MFVALCPGHANARVGAPDFCSMRESCAPILHSHPARLLAWLGVAHGRRNTLRGNAARIICYCIRSLIHIWDEGYRPFCRQKSGSISDFLIRKEASRPRAPMGSGEFKEPLNRAHASYFAVARAGLEPCHGRSCGDGRRSTSSRAHQKMPHWRKWCPSPRCVGASSGTTRI